MPNSGRGIIHQEQSLAWLYGATQEQTSRTEQMVGLPNRAGRCTICKLVKVKVDSNMCPETEYSRLSDLFRTVRSFTPGLLEMQAARSKMRIRCYATGTGIHQPDSDKPVRQSS
jgi:hypothetical protein